MYLKVEHIKLKLSGNWKFVYAKDENHEDVKPSVSFLNENGVRLTAEIKDDDVMEITFTNQSTELNKTDYKFTPDMLTDMTISGINCKDSLRNVKLAM